MSGSGLGIGKRGANKILNYCEQLAKPHRNRHAFGIVMEQKAYEPGALKCTGNALQNTAIGVEGTRTFAVLYAMV